MSDTKEHGSSSASGSGKRYRGQRGKTKALDIVNMPNKDRIEVEVNEWGQPNKKKSASKLVTWIGTIARNRLYCPQTYPNWKKIPQPYKDDCWKVIKDKFIIHDDSKNWVFDRLNHRWREHKCDLKAEYYTKYDSDSDRRMNLDPHVMPIEDWDVLLKYWDDEKNKEISEQNKKNKKNQKMHHRTGSTSFAVIREKMRNENLDKKPPSRMEMFDRTHTPSKGGEMDPESAKTMDQLRVALSKESEERQKDSAVQDEVFRGTLKRNSHGWVRMYGPGVTPKQVFGIEGLRTQRREERIVDLRAENSQLKEKIAQQDDKIAEQSDKIAQQGWLGNLEKKDLWSTNGSHFGEIVKYLNLASFVMILGPTYFENTADMKMRYNQIHASMLMKLGRLSLLSFLMLNLALLRNLAPVNCYFQYIPGFLSQVLKPIAFGGT
ncbi:uncharacterized protein LOC122668586 [Telopea speciosissima]|uniref:uncharacterized protein LOC122668586 n=1 Tax=Telopea speciosissima TaxID=54955 RepID=UPI001CC4681B|nr:uncharacterized protein LOC122668586 [Telopea speciosissima]